ncbi:MAG: tetratricopeptide repeat protein [Planctomycetota bacterium]
MRLLILGLLLFGVTTAATADVVVLNDGSEVQGDIRRATGGYDVILKDGTRQFIPDSQVKSLRMGPSQTDADVQLANLRRSVEPLEDLDLVIERYEQFLERIGEGEVADKARVELAQWVRWREEGRVLFDGEWMKPQEQRERAAQNIVAVNEVRGMIKSGKRGEALKLVHDRLRENPRDVSSHYLLGLMQYRSGDVAGARRSFEEAAVLAPDHAPTANNLAVVLVRQNQLPRAVLALGNALRDAPDTKSLLDNAAELIELVPEAQRDTTVYANLRTRFEAQDRILGSRLAEQGWHRFGAKWVDAATFATIEAQRKEANDRLDALQADYDVTNQRIVAVQNDIAEAEQTLASIRANSLRRTGDGRIIQLPLPDVYFEIEREKQADERDLGDLASRIGLLQQEAMRVRERMPKPLYDGTLELIGADGVPVTMPMPE